MDPDLSLQNFIAQTMLEIMEFNEYYKLLHKRNPETYPLKLSIPDWRNTLESFIVNKQYNK